MNISKNDIKKYKDFLKESLNPYRIKIGMKSFNRMEKDMYTIHGDLKNLSDELTNELNDLKLPYHKLIIFGGLEIDLIIKQTNKYYSSINWYKFLKDDNEIIVEIPNDYDINYLVSLIIHEIRHMMDFVDEKLNSGLSSFNMDFKLRDYNNEFFYDFYFLFYLSLEHEMVARNNQIYPYIKFKNLTKEESLELVKKTSIWKSLNMLSNFDYNNFVNSRNYDILVKMTNGFIKDILHDNDTIIENKKELLNFYRIFSDYFKELSEKWMNILLSEIDKVYERKIYNHLHDNYNYSYVIKDIWNKIKNN